MNKGLTHLNMHYIKEGLAYLSMHNVVTQSVKIKIEKHIQQYKLKGEICAWYEDWDDFCSDWCDNIGYTKGQARKLLHGGKGEFQIIDGYGIIRYVI